MKYSQKKTLNVESCECSGITASEKWHTRRSRTPNLLVRSQALYPIELRVQTVCQSIEQARMSKLKAKQPNQAS